MPRPSVDAAAENGHLGDGPPPPPGPSPPSAVTSHTLRPRPHLGLLQCGLGLGLLEGHWGALQGAACKLELGGNMGEGAPRTTPPPAPHAPGHATPRLLTGIIITVPGGPRTPSMPGIPGRPAGP